MDSKSGAQWGSADLNVWEVLERANGCNTVLTVWRRYPYAAFGLSEKSDMRINFGGSMDPCSISAVVR